MSRHRTEGRAKIDWESTGEAMSSLGRALSSIIGITLAAIVVGLGLFMLVLLALTWLL